MYKKKIMKFNIIVWLVILTISTIYVYYNRSGGYQEFINLKFNGIVKEIIYYKGNRGMPDFKVSTEWYYLGLDGEEVTKNFKVGDSIIKEKGSTTIKLYRKNKKGEWNVKIYK